MFLPSVAPPTAATCLSRPSGRFDIPASVFEASVFEASVFEASVFEASVFEASVAARPVGRGAAAGLRALQPAQVVQ